MAADAQLHQVQQQQPNSSGRRRHHRRRHLRNETLFVLSLIQGLCALAALILCSVAFSTHGPVLTACAEAAAALLVMCVSVHGLATSRRKTYCTVLALFVLCQLACLAGLVLLVGSSVGLHAATAGGGGGGAAATSDMVICGLTLVIGLLELGVALACCLLCARQLCRQDARIALDPRGRGLIIVPEAAPPPPPPHLPPPLPMPPGYAVVDGAASVIVSHRLDPPPAYAP